MDKNVEKQLAELFAAHDAKKERVRQVRTEREEKEAVFLSQFLERRANVFRPAFEAFATSIEAQDIKCRIEEKEEKPMDQHQTQPASIAIVFLISDEGNRPQSEYPHLIVSCEKHSGTVTLYKSTMAPGRGGQSGPAEKVGIEDITENSLHQALVEILQRVLL